jgi:hypothetical protein
MSDEHTKSPSFVRVIGPALMVACCVLIAPFLLLALAYLEHVFIGTHQIKEALHVDQVLHELEAKSRQHR